MSPTRTLTPGTAGGGVPSSAPSATTDPAPTGDTTLADLMAGAGMTPSARRMFLVATPHIEDAGALARSCAEVLGGDLGSVHAFGCVTDGRIHLLAFDDPAVHDFAYVVAAHELLHLAYSRLPAAERARLDAQLQAARSANPLLEERLRVYAASAKDTLNEVHSILGTEFGDLTPELEAHYSRYIDRGLVTAAFERTLGGRQREMRRLKAVITDLEARLDQMTPVLDALRASGPVRAYNAMVGDYNALVDEHNAAVADLKALVDEYNRLSGS